MILLILCLTMVICVVLFIQQHAGAQQARLLENFWGSMSISPWSSISASSLQLSSPQKPKSTSGIEIVIAQYNEKIDFVEKPPFLAHNIIVYNKGPSTPTCPDCVKIETLSNVGKCDHTYLYHIIHNYDNLADVTVFLSGSCMMHGLKQKKTLKTIEYVEKTRNSVFIGKGYNNVYKDLYGFKLNQYLTANRENQLLNNDTSLKPCKIRPFGKWYNSLFGNLKTTLVDFTSIFAVSRNHIHQHSKSYYENLISFIDNDISPECGHYIERSWVAVFDPIPAECLYNNYA
jgi:hypothetical protein